MATELELAVKAALDAERKEQAEKAEKEAALRASIVEELKGEPKYKALFSIGGVEAKDKGLPAEKQETYEYIWNLRHGINPGLAKSAQDRRTLDELTAAEGLPLVPSDLLNEIWIQRQAVSIARKAGIRTFTTNRRVFNIPSEVTPMTAPAVVAEEGAYAENEIVFGTVVATLDKHGSQVTVTEELLEDQSMFQSYFVGAVGRAMGLAENIDLHAILSVTGAQGDVAADSVVTDPELMALYGSLAQVYRQGASWFMNDDTMTYLRAILIATPRAYGEFPAFGGGDWENFMGKPVYCNANWVTRAAAANDENFISFANVGECMALVEHSRGLQIFVDPYTLKDTGWVSYYPSARWDMVAVQAAACVGLQNHV